MKSDSLTTSTANVRSRPVTLFILVAFVSAAGVFLWNSWFIIGGKYLYNSPDLSPLVPLSRLPQIASIDPIPGEVPAVLDLPLSLRLLSVVPDFVLIVVFAIVIFYLGRILRGIISEEVFSKSSVDAWVRIGLSLIFGAVLFFLFDALAILTFANTIMGEAPVRVLNLEAPRVDLRLLCVGAVCLTISHAFRQGKKNREDLDGLV